MLTFLSETTRQRVVELLEHQERVLRSMLDENERARGLCLEELDDGLTTLTLAAQLTPGQTVMVDGDPETVASVRAIEHGDIPHVLVRTNAHVRLVPAGRVVEVIR